MPAASSETRSFVPEPSEENVSQPSALTVKPGTVIGRYEVLSPIASGGMADVWIGRSLDTTAFARLVAIKTVRADYANDEDFRKLFVREAQVASTIRHSNVVEVFDVGESDGITFQIMSLVEGATLSSLVKKQKGPLPLAVACEIMLDVLRGLNAAHEAVDASGRPLGLVHRDVSPQNILVGLDGVARISDFGIAKIVMLAEEKTATGVLRGKCGYLAPEQVKRAPIDRRTDLFAAGIVFWEALTGRRLFRGEDIFETFHKITQEPIPSPDQSNPQIPSTIARICMCALAKNPNERFVSAATMAEALGGEMSRLGMAPSAGDVAALVDRLEGNHIRERSRQAKVAATGRRRGSSSNLSSQSLSAPTLSSLEGTSARPSGIRLVVTGLLVAAAAIALIGVGIVLARVRDDRPPLVPAGEADPAKGATANSATNSTEATPAANVSPASVLPSAERVAPSATVAAAATSGPSAAHRQTGASRPLPAEPRLPVKRNPFR